MSQVIVEVHIEIPTGSQNKYEFDKDNHVLRLDRVLYSAVHYPADYGYVAETLEEDGDSIDVLVMVTNPTVPGCVVDCRIVGVLIMSDDKGVDSKLLGVPLKDPRFAETQDLCDVPPHKLLEIEHFFQTYKDLEGKSVSICGWQDSVMAGDILNKARRRYSNHD